MSALLAIARQTSHLIVDRRQRTNPSQLNSSRGGSMTPLRAPELSFVCAEAAGDAICGSGMVLSLLSVEESELMAAAYGGR